MGIYRLLFRLFGKGFLWIIKRFCPIIPPLLASFLQRFLYLSSREQSFHHFPNLPPYLLEEIITKLDERSYCRLQQTCKDVNDFVRKSRNIKVCSKQSLSFEFYSNLETFSRQLRFTINSQRYISSAEGFNGIRFEKFSPPNTITGDFEQFCVPLKEYRITADAVAIRFDTRWTKEQCAALFKILKPGKVHLPAEKSDRYEALFNVQSLEKASVDVGPHNALVVTKHLLATLHDQKLKIYVSSSIMHPWNNRNTEQIFDLFISILQLLRSEPNRASFYISESTGRPTPPSGEVMEKFRDFNPTLMDEWDRFGHNGYTLRCLLDRSAHHYCDVILSNKFAAVKFQPPGHKYPLWYSLLLRVKHRLFGAL